MPSGLGNSRPATVTFSRASGSEVGAKRQAGFQRGDRKPVRRLGIEGEQRPPAEPFERRDHASIAGKTWRPSAPSGNSFAHFTAASGSGA